MGPYETLGKEVGALVDTKQECYGNSFGNSEAFLRLLYPDGIKPEQYKDLLTIIRIFDKLKRIATNNDSLGEDPWADICGYSILALGGNKNKNG